MLCNPTGSTGFGEAFNNTVKSEWGGRPYGDLSKCFEYNRKGMEFVDTDRAVAFNCSYGDYMINWIAEQPFAKKFKALVCHDDVFSLYSMYGCHMPTGMGEECGGQVWEKKARWNKWDPAQHTENWTAPMLIIHSDGHYRCNISDEFAAFNVCESRGSESKFSNFSDENHFRPEARKAAPLVQDGLGLDKQVCWC